MGTRTRYSFAGASRLMRLASRSRLLAFLLVLLLLTPTLAIARPAPSPARSDVTQPRMDAVRQLAQVGAAPTAGTTPRTGIDGLWQYTAQSYGGGTTAQVNLSTGNLALTHSGGGIPTRGFAVSLTHTYNSQAASDSDNGYGVGWSFAHDLRLAESANGSTVTFTDGSGAAFRVFTADQDAGGTRTNERVVHYGYILTKDISSPPANKVFTLIADQGVTQIHFNATGRVTLMEDRNGNTLTFGYASGKLTTITDVANRVTTLAYHATSGRLIEITDMAGRVSTYGYDTAGNLTTIAHGVGSADAVTTTFGYADGHLLTSVTNPRGHTAAIDYAKLFDWETASSTEGWTAGAHVASVAQSTVEAHTGTGSLEADLQLLGDDEGSVGRNYSTPVALSSVDGELTVWVYKTSTTALDAFLRVTDDTSAVATGPSVALGNNIWTAVTFPEAPISPDTPVSKLEVVFQKPSSGGSFFNEVYIDDVAVRGIVVEQTDAKAAQNTIRSYSYDVDTATTTVQQPDDAGVMRDTTVEYTASGQTAQTTDALANAEAFSFDADLRLTAVSHLGSGGSTIAYMYYADEPFIQTITNELDEITRLGTNTANGDTRYTIDPLNEGRRTNNQAFQATVFTRDAAGNVTSVAENWYAAGANLEQTPLPSPTSTERSSSNSYATGGVTASMTDANGNTTNYDYAAGTANLTEIDAPAGSGESSRRVTTMTRNADGTLASVDDPRGITTDYTYDGLGRLTAVDFGEGRGDAVSVTYTLDDNGNMTAMTDEAGSSSWSFDENNRVISESRTQNNQTKNASYTYHASGLLTSMTTFGNQTVSFGYDDALRLVTQTDPKDAGRTIDYGYDGRGRRTSIEYGSGVTQSMTYDLAGRIDVMTLENSGGTDLQRFDYAYGINSSGVRTADYHNGDVASVTELDNSVVTYDYDALDRLSAAERTGTNPFDQSYTYDDNDNRTSITSGTTTTNATFDAANQMTQLGSTSYDYDPNGNLTGLGSAALFYNAANQWFDATGSLTAFLAGYDGLGRRAHVGGGASRVDHWYDQSGLTLDSGASNATYLRGPGGLLLSTYSGTTLSNYARDRNGSTTGLTSTSGTLTGTYRYDPWGTALGTPPSTYNPMRYAGTYHDSGTGLYQMGARYYQPAAGRFTSLDPLGGRYIYAAANPANFTDPTGLFEWDVDWLWTEWDVDIYIPNHQMNDAGTVLSIAGGVIGFAVGGWGGSLAGLILSEVPIWYLENVNESGGYIGVTIDCDIPYSSGVGGGDCSATPGRSDDV